MNVKPVPRSRYINDPSPSEAVRLRRIRALDFHPKEYLQVLCLHAGGEGLGQLEVESIAGQLRPLLHHALYTRYHQQLVILISRDDVHGVGDYGEQLLEEIAALNGLSCGISSTYDRVVRTRAAYLQARRAVRDYDEQHGGDLMDTPYCCLQVAGSTTRAAQMLTLHKNTLLYRLNRIRQILGINLASGEDLFQPQMSFRIMLYLGLFRPRLVMAREQLRG